MEVVDDFDDERVVNIVVEMGGDDISLGLGRIGVVEYFIFIELPFLFETGVEKLGVLRADDCVDDILSELAPLHMAVSVDVDVLEQMDQSVHQLVFVLRRGVAYRTLH